MRKSRTWNRDVYSIVATLAFHQLGPYSTWTKKVKISKKNGEMASHPTGPEHMSDQDIKAAWELIHEAASRVCQTHGLNAPASESACYMPLAWVMQSSPGTFNSVERIRMGLGYLPFAQVAVEEKLITKAEYDQYVSLMMDADCLR